jgi:hypothetical protein
MSHATPAGRRHVEVAQYYTKNSLYIHTYTHIRAVYLLSFTISNTKKVYTYYLRSPEFLNSPPSTVFRRTHPIRKMSYYIILASLYTLESNTGQQG